MPHVYNSYLGFGYEHYSNVWLAPARRVRLPVPIDHAAAGHHAGMAASAAKAKMAADTIAAIGHVGALRRPKISGEDTIWCGEQPLGHRRLDRKSVV